jgi:CBS domain-containing protein
MSIKTVMTRAVHTVSCHSTLQEAAKLMRDGHVGDLVVVDPSVSEHVPVGIITDRDIVVSCVAFGIGLSTLTVGDTMVRNLVTVRDYEAIKQVLQTMREFGVRRAPVLNGQGVLVGIVSVEDILNLLVDEMGTIADISRRQKIFELQRRGVSI